MSIDQELKIHWAVANAFLDCINEDRFFCWIL